MCIFGERMRLQAPIVRLFGAVSATPLCLSQACIRSAE